MIAELILYKYMRLRVDKMLEDNSRRFKVDRELVLDKFIEVCPYAPSAIRELVYKYGNWVRVSPDGSLNPLLWIIPIGPVKVLYDYVKTLPVTRILGDGYSIRRMNRVNAMLEGYDGDALNSMRDMLKDTKYIAEYRHATWLADVYAADNNRKWYIIGCSRWFAHLEYTRLGYMLHLFKYGLVGDDLFNEIEGS